MFHAQLNWFIYFVSNRFVTFPQNIREQTCGIKSVDYWKSYTDTFSLTLKGVSIFLFKCWKLTMADYEMMYIQR